MNTLHSSWTRYCIFFLLLLLLLSFVLLSTDVANAATDEPIFIDYVIVNSDSQLKLDIPSFSVKGSDYFSLQFDVQFDSNNSWMTALFASYNSSSDRGIFFLVNPANGKLSLQYGEKWSGEVSKSALGSSRHRINTLFSKGEQYMIVDGSEYARYSYSPTYDYSISYLSLFKRDVVSGSANLCYFRGKVYSVLLNYNGVALYDLKPAILGDTVGFYDTVSQKFFTPTSGSWTSDYVPDDPDVPDVPGLPDLPVFAPTIDYGLLGVVGEVIALLWAYLPSAIMLPVVNVPAIVWITGIFVLSMLCKYFWYLFGDGGTK